MFYIGIDGGGTKCSAIIQNEAGEILGSGRGGPANPVQGYERTLYSILDATAKASAEAGLSEDNYSSYIAGVGLAGINHDSIRQKIQTWEHPFGQMFLTTDLEIASIGAHQGKGGAVIIVGTGSSGYCDIENDRLILGGHGFPIGDKASGAWIGLKAIEYTLLALDGFIEETLLTDRVCEYYAVDSSLALSEVILGSVLKRYAEIASLTYKAADHGDIYARSIIDEGIKYVSQMANKLLEHNPSRISMIGGLSNMVLDRLEPSLAEKFDEPLFSPEMGAILYARQCLKDMPDSIAMNL